MPRNFFLLVPAVVAAAVLAAGCGGGGSSSASGTSNGSSSGSSQATASGPATVAVRSTPLGSILVANNRTLYLFQKDTGTTSTCSGACAQAWPPLLTSGSPKGSGSASASMLGTTKRSDGKLQVTYAGHPLYFFAEDTQAGQTKGQALNFFGAPWYVVSPAGKEITKTVSGSSSSTSSGGYGY